MGKIFYLMGRSSSGKDTLFKRLTEQLKEIRTVVLYTTRPIRQGEQDGREYFYVTEKRLEEMEREKRVIELRSYHTMHGVWKYFTADDGQIDLDETSYLMIGTLESYEKMKDYFGPERMKPIYIEVEDGERLTRALERERSQEFPKYAEMCRRFLADAADFAESKLSEAQIGKSFRNDDLESCLNEIKLYIRENL